MYKITVTLVRTGKQEILFANDFEANESRLIAYSNDGVMAYMLHSIESFHVKEVRENN